MKAAVTGGSGVVGTAVVRHLVASGHDVTGLARSTIAAQRLEALGASVVRGHILDPAALDELAHGADSVFHVAGVNELCPSDPGVMWRVNVDGTMLMLRAAERAGAGRFIHTSSAVTIGEAKGMTGTEDTNHRGQFLSEYERSKHEAEARLLEATVDIEVVMVNPSSVQGPGRATGSGALLLEAARGRLPALIDTPISIVDIDDCARGHLLAAERGTPGERYLLSGETVWVRRLVFMLNEITGRRWSPAYVRPSLLTFLAPIVAKAFALVGKSSPICAESARVLVHGHRYDGSKAARELGIRYTPLDDTLRRTIAWFSDEGLISSAARHP
jgi:dihydroflavonol-4-reductase